MAFKYNNFSDRQTASADAKKAMLAAFKPKPTVQAEKLVSREEERAAELERVRQERAAAKIARAQAQAEKAELARLAAEVEAAAEREAKRTQIKERKALQAAEQKNKRADRAMSRMERLSQYTGGY